MIQVVMRDCSDIGNRTATHSREGDPEGRSGWFWAEAALIAIPVIAGYVGLGLTVVSWAVGFFL